MFDNMCGSSACYKEIVFGRWNAFVFESYTTIPPQTGRGRLRAWDEGRNNEATKSRLENTVSQQFPLGAKSLSNPQRGPFPCKVSSCQEGNVGPT